MDEFIENTTLSYIPLAKIHFMIINIKLQTLTYFGKSKMNVPLGVGHLEIW